jgi:hypothetical protein
MRDSSSRSQCQGTGVLWIEVRLDNSFSFCSCAPWAALGFDDASSLISTNLRRADAFTSVGAIFRVLEADFLHLMTVERI